MQNGTIFAQADSNRKETAVLTQEQRLSWLQLIRSENVGSITFHLMLARFGSADGALAALPELALRGGKKRIKVARRQDALREMERAQSLGVHFIGVNEPDYPPLLRLASAPPPLIAVKGSLTQLKHNCIGIVGARNASAAGRRLAAHFASRLGEAGFTIVSGFARGIDTAAHEASLQTGTIAMMAGGVDKIYPPENSNLYKKILAQGGTLISEMPLGAEPRAKDFPRRNRLIAGISFATLIVEAARRSGSLITARLAGENGRLVFSIPGSPLDPNAAGCNDLIKQGAILTDNPQEIIDCVLPMLERQPARETQERFPGFGETQGQMPSPAKAQDVLDDKARQRLIEALSLTPVDRETLAMSADLSLPQLYLGLLELDLAGKLLHHENSLISLNPVQVDFPPDFVE